MNDERYSAFPAVTEGRIGDNLVQTVNARDLHEYLENGDEFSHWIKDRIDQYGFTENVDFVTFRENSQKGRPRIEYALSLNMGKELGMVDRSPKGKEVRQYFIECEKRALAKAVTIPTTAEAFANAFMMIADAQRVQAQHAAKIAAIDEKMDRMEQALVIHDKVPPNGELITYLRKRVQKEFKLSAETINKVLDVFSVHPKFAVRNHHENADGGVNYGYWKREINAVFKRFISECVQVTPSMCEHPYIEGRFRFVKPTKPASRMNGSHLGNGERA
jgi:phage anti-repressor protein